MEEAPENGKESSHSAHANGMNDGDVNVFGRLGVNRHISLNQMAVFILSSFCFVFL